MKIAIFLSGRILSSNINTVIQNLKMFINTEHDVIFFCSINSNVHDNDFSEKFCKEMDIDNERFDVQETVEPDELHYYQKRSETNVHRTYSMFFHNKMCYQMILRYQQKYKLNFDVIVKYRTDIESTKVFIFDKVEQNTIYIPRGADWANGINDQIAYGDIHSMGWYCECIDHIQKYCKDGIIFHPESLLKHHLNQSPDFKIERFHFDYKLAIKNFTI
jgi:hypothetical protein